MNQDMPPLNLHNHDDYCSYFRVLCVLAGRMQAIQGALGQWWELPSAKPLSFSDERHIDQLMK